MVSIQCTATVRLLDIKDNGLWEGTVAVGRVEAWRGSARGLEVIWELCEVAVGEVLSPSGATVDWTCSFGEWPRRERTWHGQVTATDEPGFEFGSQDRVSAESSPFEFTVDPAEAHPGVSSWVPQRAGATRDVLSSRRRVAGAGLVEAVIVRGFLDCFMAQVDFSTRDARADGVRTRGAYHSSSRFDFLVDWVEEYVGLHGEGLNVAELSDGLTWRRTLDVAFDDDHLAEHDLVADEYWSASVAW